MTNTTNQQHDSATDLPDLADDMATAERLADVPGVVTVLTDDGDPGDEWRDMEPADYVRAWMAIAKHSLETQARAQVEEGVA